LFVASSLAARTPEIAVDPKEGVWIAAGETFVQQARDRWSVFAGPARVNELVVDNRTVWVATDDGVLRFEADSRRTGQLTMDDGLPSQAVAAVAVDEQYVWFGTNRGLARYRKLDRTIRVYDDQNGLPDRGVNDVMLVGREIWIGTRDGIAVYDPDSDGLRAYGTKDGLASGYVAEIYRVGDDIWFRTDVGLSRYRPATRLFTNVSLQDLGGQEIHAFVPDGERIWIGTENGLRSFETTSDAVIAFPQQAQLKGKSVVGIEPFTDYLFITTDQEVVQFHKEKKTFRRFTAADGIARQTGSTGSVLNSGRLALMYDDGAEVYDIQRDVWFSRPLQVTERAGDAAAKLSWQVWSKADTEWPFDLVKLKSGDERYATIESGAGAGYQMADGRSLDLSLALDYGEVELPGIRDLKLHGQYLGTSQNLVRELTVDDMLKVETVEAGLEKPFLLQGGKSRFASQGDQPLVSVESAVGARRGATAREFITGPRQEVYALQHKYVLAGSEKVLVDGELLTSGADYTVIYPAGQLAFLDPERIDDLSVIEVEYEYDLMPKKGLGVVSLLDLVPADREVGGWVRAGEPTVIHEESGLYAQIDGAAPKYIDRGWVRSVYAEYRAGSRTLQLAIHDMGDEQHALDLYGYDLPPAREPVGDRPNMVLDVGLATSYAVKSVSKGYYIELTIDDKSDAAKQSIKLFALQVVDRGANAGANKTDALRELVTQTRAAIAPARGLEFGGRVLQLTSLSDASIDAAERRRMISTVDGRYETSVGERGKVIAYGEAAASDRIDGPRRNPGWGTLGRLRFSHPYFEGSAEGRYQDPTFAPLGSTETIFGRLQDEERIDATAYPTRWLPTTVFVSRQISRVEGSDQTAAVQHAMTRVQLTEEHLPATSLQLGHSLLDDAGGRSTSRVKAVAQADYDLATGALSFLGMKRFLLRGLYGVSDATTTDDNRFDHADRVELTRLEAKLAPTATETAYALFRSRAARRQLQLRDDHRLLDYGWELNSGARSAFVPGLIPQANYAAIYGDHRDVRGDNPTRVTHGSISARLGVYPGDWWSALAPFALDTRYSLGDEEKSEAAIKTLWQQVHRVDNRLNYNGMGKFELELYQLFETALADQVREQQRQRLELRNRAIYRPVFTSPITVRFDVIDEQTRNDVAAIEGARPWGEMLACEAGIEWLMRWTQLFSSKLKGTYTTAQTGNLLVVDPVTGSGQIQNFQQRQLTPELELRFLVQGDVGSLFILQRDRFYYLFGEGTGATDAWGFEVGLGAIWKLGDNIYLDGDVSYAQTECLAQPCTPTREVRPRLLLSVKL